MDTDEAPTLSSTDDPFDLLGIDPATADSKQIRRAYAKLIKVFRPDRHPVEFGRIHAAYENALAQLEYELHQVAQPLPPSAAPPTGGHAHAPPTRAEALTHPISYLLDEPAGFRARLEEYVEEDDLEGLKQFLALDVVTNAAVHAPGIASACIDAVTTLLWRGEHVQELVWAYSEQCSFTDQAAKMECALELSRQWTDEIAKLPTSLVAFIKESALASDARRLQLKRTAHAFITESEPAKLLAVFDTLSRAKPQLVAHLSTWFSIAALLPSPAFAELDRSTTVDVDGMMIRGGARPRWHPKEWWRMLWNYLPALPIAALISGLVYGYRRLFAGFHYRRRGREQLAELVVIAGVTTSVVIEYIEGDPKRVPLYRWFPSRIKDDTALGLLGRIAWCLYPRGYSPPR